LSTKLKLNLKFFFKNILVTKTFWIKLIETPIAANERDLNGSLDLNDQLCLNKVRYYRDSKYTIRTPSSIHAKKKSVGI
jgi:hypothetical protein